MKKAIIPLLLIFLSLLFLSAVSPPYLKQEIRIYLDGEELPGGSLRIELTHAMRAKRSGGYRNLYDELCRRYEPKDALNYLAIGLGDYLSAECERRKVDPLDATLEWTKKISAPFIYYKEKPGREANLAEVGEIVARAMDREEGGCAYVCTREVLPAVTQDALRKRTEEIARFSTEFHSSGANRRHNLALAAQAISGTILSGGESFSFNKTVGERSAERGFLEANIVVNGEFKKGVGGGVCQVSTTLYNAVLLAGIPVEYAAAHSRPVSYVPYSRDCTVSSVIDFRFLNDGAHPIYIAAEVKNSRLTFVLYGEKKSGVRSLESEIVEHIPYRCLYENGKEADPSTDILISEGREGIKSRLYLVEEKEDITRTQIRENLYPAKDALYQKAPT